MEEIEVMEYAYIAWGIAVAILIAGTIVFFRIERKWKRRLKRKYRG